MRNKESMRMPRITSASLWLALFIMAVALLVSYSILARAHAQNVNEPTDQEIKASGIAFPIPELGNCGSKDECKNYCNDQGHMDVCISFAKSHGLMNKDEAARAEKFRSDLQNGAGPGGCTSPSSCQSFCSDVKNIEVCVKFAEGHGFKDKHIEQARKLLDYMKAGGQTPGGCTSEDSCKQYCGDFSHAEECFNFAKKAGIVQEGKPGTGGGNGPNMDQIQKFLDLAKSGQTPGGCKTKDECESYCKDESRREECVAFATKIGAITQDQADKIRKSTGNGPGNCNSQDACAAYCNDPAHQEECFKFAEEHGFVQHEEIQRAKEGFVRLRAGLEQAPPEVAECLKSVVGENALDDIQSGKITPGPEIGQSVKGCFEKFGHKGNSTEIFKNAPPEVVACLEEKLGDDFAKVQSGAIMPTPEMADTFRVCSQQVQLENGNFGGPGAPQGAEQDQQGDQNQEVGRGQQGDRGQQGQGQQFGPPSRQAQDFLRHAPPGVATCLKDKAGDQLDKIQSGKGQLTPEFNQTLKSCFEGFKPQNEYQGFRPKGQEDQDQENNQGSQDQEGSQDQVDQDQGGGGQQGEFTGPGGREGDENNDQAPALGAPGTDEFNQSPNPPPPSQGEKPLFNQKPYYQSVPSFNNTPPSSGPYPISGSQPYQQPYPSSGTYSPGGPYPSGGATYPSGTYPTYPSGTTYPSGGAYSSGTLTYPSSGTYPSGTYSSGTAYPTGGTYPSSTYPTPTSYSTDPATNCAKAGGTWDTSTNYCRMPGSTSPSPSGTTQSCPSGQYWNGTSCVNSTTATPPPSDTTHTCPSGQYWNGSSCVSSTTTTPPPGANLFQILKSFLFGR